MPEDYEEFISLTLRTRNSKKPLRMLARNWKRQWLLLCFARQARKESVGRPVANPMRSNPNLRVFWKASESTRLRMEESTPNHHEDHITGKGDNSLQHNNLVHTLISYASSHEDSRSKGSGGQGMGKIGKNPAWHLTKVRNKKDVINEARNKGRKVHFAPLMDLCHLKNSELEPRYQKCKGRVVFRGDIVKDDSGSYAEQGSSASQMTAAKVMDIRSDCQDAEDKQRTQYLLIPT